MVLAFLIAALSAAPLAGTADEIGAAALAGYAQETTVGELSAAGLRGSFRYAVDLRSGAFVETDDLGPYSGESGFDGKRPWERDASKEVLVDETAAAKAAATSTAYRNRFGYLHPEANVTLTALPAQSREGKSFEIVHVEIKEGRPFDLWIDPATHLPARITDLDDTKPHSIEYADYRRVEGIAIPFSIHDVPSNPRSRSEYRVKTVIFSKRAEAQAFAIPPPAPPDYSVAGPVPVVLPFTLESNHLIVDVTLDGKPARAIFDTGGRNALTPSLAKTLGLQESGSEVGVGAGEATVNIGFTRARSLGFGSIAMRDQNFAVIPLPNAITHGGDRPVEMIVGYEILKRFVTRIDYAARTLTFTPARAFTYRGSGVAVPLVFDDTTPRVRGSLDGLPGLFQIDTGSAGSVTLTSPFVAANDLRHKYKIAGNVVTGRGVGGYSHSDLARGRTLMLGTVSVSDPVLELSTDTRGAFASRAYVANVGNDVLKRFAITFDYSRRTMYLERTAAGALPPPSNRSGMYAQNDDRRYFEVVDVLPNGPAATAGLRAGDHITAIDGKPADSITADQFWTLQRGPAGTSHTFNVDRAGTASSVTLTLRDVI